MAIFPQIKHEKIIQVGDQIRIDASKTVIAKPDTLAEIDIVEISPNNVDFVIIKASGESLNQKDWFLDWVYEDLSDATDGLVTIAVRITHTDAGVFNKTSEVNLLTEAEDNLFTTDFDLLSEEHDILEWLPEGYSSFTYLHRRAKNRIFSWLNEQQHFGKKGSKLTIDDVFDKSEFVEWSRYLVLKSIFNMAYNARGDVFKDKYDGYCKKEGQARTRVFSLDLDGDGVDDGDADKTNTATAFLRRG